MSFHNLCATKLQVLRPGQAVQWMDVLAHSFQHDFYHLPQYHALAEERKEGKAHLFVYREAGYFVAVPLLLRPIEASLCPTETGEGYWDATCVYGYAGPVASHSKIPAVIQRNFQSALHKALLERRVVAVFSRLHPLIPQRGLLAGLGEYTASGNTISLDLTLPISMQRARYRRNHKRDINRLRRLGVTCWHDRDWATLDEFVSIYHETMRRVSASGTYFFDRAYFEGLMSALASQMHLFVCLMGNRVICGGLFALCDGIVQYHLGGTRGEYLELSPMKLLIDDVRLWANEHCASVFHLGGGVQAKKDSLFHFKAGFSDRVHDFPTWRWVLLPEVYDRLCEDEARWSEQHGLECYEHGFFPEYRCPGCSRIEVASKKGIKD